MDTVEDVARVGALHEREVPSEVSAGGRAVPELPHGPHPAQEGGRVCVCPTEGPGAWLLTLQASSKDTGNQKRRKKACGQ